MEMGRRSGRTQQETEQLVPPLLFAPPNSSVVHHVPPRCRQGPVQLTAGTPTFSQQPHAIFLHLTPPNSSQDINSPFRHVRTRIYFTSESHIHSLVNVLRFCEQCETTLTPPYHPPPA
jgi:hypothetical protein